MASSHYELATWIEKYIIEKYGSNSNGFLSLGSEWSHLEQLFTILRVAGSHKHSEVTRLVDDAIGSVPLSVYRLLLPIKMLWALANVPPSSEWPKYKAGTSNLDIADNARLWALHLVHSMNIAEYLGVSEEFVNVTTTLPRPSITSFLDILHPGQPLYPSRGTSQIIINYCKAVVSPEHRTPNTTKELVQVAMNLPVTHLVAGFPEGVSHTVAIPAMIIRLFPISERSNEGDRFYDTYKVYDILDLFDLQLSSPRSSFVIWDRFREQPLNSAEKQPLKNRFFVCNELQIRWAFGCWKLVDQTMNITKMKPGDIDEPVLYPKTEPQPEESDGVVELAYRVHPQEDWDRLCEAWKIIKPMRRQRQSYKNGGGKEQSSLISSEGPLARAVEHGTRSAPSHYVSSQFFSFSHKRRKTALTQGDEEQDDSSLFEK